VAVNPAFAGANDPVAGAYPDRLSTRNLLLILILALVGVVAIWKGSGWIRRWLRERRLAFEAGERWAFGQALSACRGGDAAQTYRAINLWLGRYLEPDAQPTLLGLARKSGQPGLVVQVERLQAALIGAEGETWSGKELASELRRLRSAKTGQSKPSSSLAPLNPAQ
jgi:hypothetical protein